MKQHKYKDYQQKLILLKGIPDIHPYECTLPDAPSIEQFKNYGLPPEEQFFQREKFPVELKRLDILVKKGTITRQQGIEAIEQSKELTEFVEMLWRKRLGEELEFQIINGVPTYISPSYWGYLNFWHLDIGLPDFRTDKHHNCADLEKFYCWDLLVVPSPYCYGLTTLEGRRGGKTYVGGWLLYEPISRSYENHGYLQSKTDLDAERAFVKAVVKPWRMLPFFFQPMFSNSSFPKKEGLQFTPRSKKGVAGETDLLDDEVIMSEIVYVSSEMMAIDGQKAHRILEDETGKMSESNCYERWNVNKFTLTEKGNIIGKAFHPTTCEEMEKKGGKYFKLKFDDSDRSPIKRSGQSSIKVDSNGETVSGLWPWFVPAYCNEIFDQYGTAIVDKITDKQKQYLKSINYKYWWMTGMEAVDHQINMQKNQLQRQEIIRKKPRNIREAFASGTHYCHFNREILERRLNTLFYGYTTEMMQYMRFGHFEWVGEFGGDVKFVDTPFDQARCHVSYMPDGKMANQKVPVTKTKFRPHNTASFRSGADPFKYDTPDIKNPSKMSMGTQHIYAHFDPKVDGSKSRSEWRTNNLVYEYWARPMTKDELFEDYLKACIYYGCELYPERNNDDVLDYFRRHGFEHYIQAAFRIAVNLEKGIHYKQDSVGGDITGTKTIQKMFRHVSDFVNNDASTCVFYRTLKDILDVEKENLNPFDLFVSASYTLMATYEGEIANLQNETPDEAYGLKKSDLEEMVGGEINLF